ncbi:MAG: accessory factor UbiK family protein [Thioalkalivibrionaceae bacterium]
MITPGSLDDLTRRITESLPASIKQLQSDTEKHVRAALHSGFDRLDLVTREDFDIQVAIVGRLADQVASLEARISQLESRLDGTPTNEVDEPHDAP